MVGHLRDMLNPTRIGLTHMSWREFLCKETAWQESVQWLMRFFVWLSG